MFKVCFGGCKGRWRCEHIHTGNKVIAHVPAGCGAVAHKTDAKVLETFKAKLYTNPFVTYILHLHHYGIICLMKKWCSGSAVKHNVKHMTYISLFDMMSSLTFFSSWLSIYYLLTVCSLNKQASFQGSHTWHPVCFITDFFMTILPPLGSQAPHLRILGLKAHLNKIN